MGRLFGEATATQVESMTEEECVPKCRQRVETFLGKDAADKEFAGLY